MPRLPSSSARRPPRSSSIRWHGSQTIVISKTAASPTRTRCPIGHCSTSVPVTVRFSLIEPGTTPTDSRCSAETNSTSRLGGFAWAQPSRPSPAVARRLSWATDRPLLRAGDVQTPVIVAIALILATPPVTPAVVRLPPPGLQVPVLAQVEAAAAGRELEEQAARQRDGPAIGDVHRRPPLDGDDVAGDERLAHPHLHALLHPGDALPVGANAVVGRGSARRTATSDTTRP